MITVSTSVITVRMIPFDPSNSCYNFSVVAKELTWDLRLQAKRDGVADQRSP
jgi:hypothetical protein